MTTWTPEEQKAHRKLWVEALRSGKYQQGTTFLNSPVTGGMCCLGVACELSGLGAWSKSGDKAKGLTYSIGDDVGLVCAPPHPVQQYFGLRRSLGHYGGGSLADDNDSGKTFAQIADTIESEPEGLVGNPDHEVVW